MIEEITGGNFCAKSGSYYIERAFDLEFLSFKSNIKYDDFRKSIIKNFPDPNYECLDLEFFWSRYSLFTHPKYISSTGYITLVSKRKL
ncbi:MAG: hypothetical protein ACK5NN_11250, partial [Sphingomonadaceae bacterium]